MTDEEQEKEVELRVRERLVDERLKSLKEQTKWARRIAIAIPVAMITSVFLDDLVCCEARRIVKEEISHK